jgi:hypothetical protein
MAGECGKRSVWCQFAHGVDDLRSTPLFQANTSRSSTLPKSHIDVSHKSTTWSDSGEIGGPARCTPSPVQMWIVEMELFVATAPMDARDMLARRLQSAALEQYHD